MKISMRAAVFLFLFLMQGAFAGSAFAAADIDYEPTRYAVSLSAGNSYFPDSSVSVAQATVTALFDYDKVWPHPAPDNLFFKVEATIGSAWEPHAHFLASTDMLAVLYPRWWDNAGSALYVEAGIGLIYTDFKRPAQGLSVNFHPLLGIGLERDGQFAAIRLHHLSNAHLHEHNQSLDLAVLQVGFFF